MLLVFSSIPRGLEFWSANDTSIYEHSESNVFKSLRFSGEISYNWPNDLLEQMYTRLLNIVINYY